MRNLKKVEKAFWSSVVSFSVMSLCILFMPIASSVSEATNRISLVVIGSVFWISGIVGLVFMFFVRRERKSYFCDIHKDNQIGEKISKNILASCIQAKVSGCTAIVSFLLFIILLFTNLKYDYISFIALFFMVISICMYFIFNGKNYVFIKQIRGENQSGV